MTMEGNFSDFRSRTVVWVDDLVNLTTAIGRVEHRQKGHLGTTFRVLADNISSRLGGGKVLLTALHVVRDYADFRSMELRDIVVRLDRRNRQEGIKVTLVWWSEIADVAILRLQSEPSMANLKLGEADVLPLARTEVPVKVKTEDGDWRNSRLFPVGFPRGGEMCIPLEETRFTERVNVGPLSLLHYLGATAPGSSGCPVIDESQKVAAIHLRYGDSTQSRVSAALLGRHHTNEGLSIPSLIQHVRNDIGL